MRRRVRTRLETCFVLVTDGVVEATDEHEGQFGFERLEQILCDSAERLLSEIFEAALAAVTRHGIQQDDPTLVRRKPLIGYIFIVI